MFTTFLTTPAVIALVDDSVDVSVFYTFGEEEEKGSEKNKEIDILFFELGGSDLDIASFEVENNIEYFFKNYPKPHLNLISPPPDFQLS